MDKGKMQLAELIKYFDTYNRSEGKSPSTLRWYQQTLGMFLGWLTETGQPTTLSKIDAYGVREFILWLKERRVNAHKVEVTTVSNRVRALRAFFNWLCFRGYTESHLLQLIGQCFASPDTFVRPTYPKTANSHFNLLCVPIIDTI